SPDGKTIAIGGSKLYTLYEIATGQERARRAGLPGAVEYLCFAPDGRRLATAMSDTTVLIWDVTEQAGKPPRSKLTAQELEALWTELGGNDAAKAYRAIWQLVAAPEQATQLFSGRLKAAVAVDAKRVEELSKDLDSDQFAVRSKAAEELDELGEAAAPIVRKVLKGKVSLEARRRLESIQARFEGPVSAPELLRTLRAIEVLEHIGTPDARKV